jgi:hypothetical protein
MSYLFKSYLKNKYNIHFAVTSSNNFSISKTNVFSDYHEACETAISLNLTLITHKYVLTQLTIDILLSTQSLRYKLQALLVELHELNVIGVLFVKKLVSPLFYLKLSQRLSFKNSMTCYLKYMDFTVDLYNLTPFDNGSFPLKSSRFMILSNLKTIKNI